VPRCLACHLALLHLIVLNINKSLCFGFPCSGGSRLHFQVFVEDEYLGDIVMGPGDSLADVRVSVTLHLEGSAGCPQLYTFAQPGDVMSRVSR
jgi:hypothetical protein